ncbi:MAG TPA: hypothetical protein VFL17_16175 [Anaerolineae bacterium]|nr:hypothetical protein [Anaerolineae bacterium]
MLYARGGSRTLIAALALAGGVFAPAAASADADLFKDRCGKCHARATTLARGLKGETTAAKTRTLDTLSTNPPQKCP